MSRTNVGIGANTGQNWGGGGIIYVTNVVPAPGSPIPGSGFFQFTIGVSGALIDITKVQITINGSELAFDGTVLSGPSFIGLYTAFSSYQYSVPDNGYSFVLNRNSGFTSSPILIAIHAETVDGIATDQSYQLITLAAGFSYPPVPFGKPLTTIPLSRFKGEYNSGLLTGIAGAAFFSPALLNQNTGSILDVDSVEVRTHTADAYALQSIPQPDNSHPMLWGPAQGPLPVKIFPPPYSSSYKPILNSPIYTFLKSTQRTAVGILRNTTTGISQTIIV